MGSGCVGPHSLDLRTPRPLYSQRSGSRYVLDPRCGPDVLKKRKISCPYQELKPDSSVVQSVVSRYTFTLPRQSIYDEFVRMDHFEAELDCVYL
jgi:hypothetical protein